MAAQRLQCDQEGCEQSAEVFSFRGDLRKKACFAHILKQIGECVPIYRIAAYAFINSPEQVPAYADRKARMEKGKEHLKALDARCDQEWERSKNEYGEAKAGLQGAMTQILQEIERRAQNHYQQAKQQLKSREQHLEQFEVDRDFQLSADDAALCEAIPDEPVLNVSLRDCREQVAQLLLTEFQAWPEERTEAVMGAQGSEVGVGRSEASAPEVPRRIVQAQQYLTEGKEARETGKYEQALDQLKRARERLNLEGHEDAELSLQLGLTLLHFGNRDEAERELRRGLYPEFDPENALSVQVQIALAELYFQTGQWEETIQECVPVERQWQGNADSFELTKTLFFLVHSYYQLNRRNEGNELIRKWNEKLHASNYPWTLLLLTGEQYRAAGNQSAAAEYYKAGLQHNQVPVSYITVVSRLCLGSIYEDLGRLEDARNHYQQAYSLSSLHYPHSLSNTSCTSKLTSLEIPRIKRARSSDIREMLIKRSPRS